MIVDCFTFHNEVDILNNKRMKISLNPVVDKFVTCRIYKHTFRGRAERTYFMNKMKKDKFDEWKDKIIHVSLLKIDPR